VFPLGMYSVCTFQLAKVLETPFLLGISRIFVALALVAWVLTFFGFLARLVYVILLALRPAASPELRLPVVMVSQQSGRLS